MPLAEAGPVLAVDVGGTKIAAALVAPDGSLLRRAERPTPLTRSSDDAPTLWAVLLEVVDEALGGRQPAGVGIGCGGPMTWPDGVVSPVYIPAWRGFPLGERLAGVFPDGPVRLHNDAVTATVGEHWRGAGRGRRSFLTVVVSTGVGGGLVVDGLVDGPTGNAGHVGHIVVDPDGPPCGCGGRGCAEAIARGPAIADWAVSQGWSGEPSAAAVGTAAGRGDPLALAALARAGQAVGVALAGAAALLDLDAIAVGGGVARAGEPFLGPLRAAFTRHARLSFLDRCSVVPAALGADAGLVGAAALLLAGDRYWSPGQPGGRSRRLPVG